MEVFGSFVVGFVGSFRKFLEVFGRSLKSSEVFLKVLEVFRSFVLFVVFLGG